MVYDVAVIGAGPAGATAAKQCASGGLKTLMLDRSVFPRSKICGGGITTAALNAIGCPLPPGLTLDRVSGVQSYFGKKSVHVSHPHDFMAITDRSLFDNWLVEKALEMGVTFRQNQNLAGLTKVGQVFELRTQNKTYQAKAVIAADGVHSTTARLAGIREGFKKRALSLSVEIPLKHQQIDHETIKIFYGLVPQGYGWIFPKGDRVSVGSGCFQSSYHTQFQCLEKVAASQGYRLPEKVRGHHIPYGRNSRDIIDDGLILAGDAAGFVDPFTGEGIRFAVISGLLAGETLLNCFHHDLPVNRKNLAAYIHKCRQAVFGDLKYSYILSKAFFAVPSVMHRFLFDRHDMYHRLLYVLEGRYTYRSLLRDVMVEVPKYYLQLPRYLVSRIGQTRG